MRPSNKPFKKITLVFQHLYRQRLSKMICLLHTHRGQKELASWFSGHFDEVRLCDDDAPTSKTEPGVLATLQTWRVVRVFLTFEVKKLRRSNHSQLKKYICPKKLLTFYSKGKWQHRWQIHSIAGESTLCKMITQPIFAKTFEQVSSLYVLCNK